MMGKQNVRRRAAKKKRISEADQNPERLLQALWADIEGGRGKKALGRLQEIQKTRHLPPDFAALKFCAMAARVGELHNAGFQQESRQLKQRIESNYSQVVADVFPSSSVAAQRQIVSWLALDVVLKNIDVFVKAGLQRAVADKIMIAPLASATTAQLTALKAPFWSIGERQSYMVAREHMADGAWQEAREALASISRSSAFSPWRLFCRSMAEHARGDFTAARDAGWRLLRLWPEFVLAPVLVAMHKDIRLSPGKVDTLLKLLFPQAILEQSCVKLRSLDPGLKASSFARELYELSHAISPGNAAQASKALLQALTGDAKAVESKIHGLLNATLRYAQSQNDALFVAEMMLCLLPWSKHEWPAEHVKEYFSIIKARYAGDTVTHAIVHSQTLIWLAQQLVNISACENCIVEEYRDILLDALPWMVDKKRRFVPDLLAQALAGDSQCREHYDLALALLGQNDAYANDVTNILQRGSKAFAKDPFWCEQLSQRYAEQGQVELALLQAREALRRAPHNPAIEELVAAMHLRWANHAVSPRKLLAKEEEFLQAEQATRAHMHFGFQIARLLGLVQRNLITEAQGVAELQKFPQDAQLRALGLLIAHLTPQRARPWVKQANLSIASNKQKLPALILSITEPLHGVESLAFAAPNPVIGLNKQWSILLACTSESDLAEASLRILEVGGVAEVAKALKLRSLSNDASTRRKISLVYNVACCLRKMSDRAHTDLVAILTGVSSSDVFDEQTQLLMRLVRTGGPKVSNFLRSCIDEAKRHLFDMDEADDEDDEDDEDDGDGDEDDDRDGTIFSSERYEPGMVLDEVKHLTDAQIRSIMRGQPEFERATASMLNVLTRTLRLAEIPPEGLDKFFDAVKSHPGLGAMLRIARIFFEVKPNSRVAPVLRRQLFRPSEDGSAPSSRGKSKPRDSTLGLPF